MKKLLKILFILGFMFNVAATAETSTDCEEGHDSNRCVEGTDCKPTTPPATEESQTGSNINK